MLNCSIYFIYFIIFYYVISYCIILHYIHLLPAHEGSVAVLQVPMHLPDLASEEAHMVKMVLPVARAGQVHLSARLRYRAGQVRWTSCKCWCNNSKQNTVSHKKRIDTFFTVVCRGHRSKPYPIFYVFNLCGHKLNCFYVCWGVGGGRIPH